MPPSTHPVLPPSLSLLQRGLVMYGPPGTGKTRLAQALARGLGLTLVYHPIAGSELNRPLRGQAEAALRDLLGRSRTVPHLPCMLVIDEIDALAPSRSGSKGGEHAVSETC